MNRWVIFFFFLSTAVCGQQRIEGVVVDKETKKPIPFASLAILGTPHGTSTNLSGQFSLVVPDTFSVKVTCIGYESVEIQSFDAMKVIELKPGAIRLDAVVVTQKQINPAKIVRRAFSNVTNNYDAEPFLQKFFYRHYTRRDSLYERLTEAVVDIWKHSGYRNTRSFGGEREEMRVVQLRRSLDITGMVQAKKPLHVGHVLEGDLIGYQTNQKSSRLDFFTSISTLKTDFGNYTFKFDEITNYDGQEVYKIDYAYRKDSVLTTTGYKMLPQATGSLFITTDTYAFIKTDEVKFDVYNTIRTTAYYRKYGNKYYPYHLIREGQNFFLNHQSSSSHVELISMDIAHGENEKFSGTEPGRAELLKLPYDSGFWNNASILKTTPLEEDIIRDLGRGFSLNKQFYLYKEYEHNVTDGGNSAEEKFNWLRDDSKGKRMLYICFWDDRFKTYLVQLEQLKQLNLLYRNYITFVMISTSKDEAQWKKLVTDYNFFSDGIVNYRIGDNSRLLRQFELTDLPAYVLILKNGEVENPKQPTDPAVSEELRNLIGKQ